MKIIMYGKPVPIDNASPLQWIISFKIFLMKKWVSGNNGGRDIKKYI